MDSHSASKQVKYANSLSDSICPTSFLSSMNNKHVQRQIFLKPCLYLNAHACDKEDVKMMFCTVSFLSLGR